MLKEYEREKETNKNHVATPRWVVENIYDIIKIKSFNSIWFPFNNYDSQFKLKADELKLKYKATHIFDDLGNDFFKTEPPASCDLLISNPPFDQQNEIIKRSFELIENGQIKAFCLLLPLSTLETEKRANIYEKYIDKLSILIFKKRIKFIGRTSSFNTACCWICYNINNLKNTIYWI
ncbi:MAG: sugar-phosphate nucleotidyltransferase [Clostridia bacterium]|nr:sugar-phosphate nucleotidyltransferase [Clostridia bacterium]